MGGGLDRFTWTSNNRRKYLVRLFLAVGAVCAWDWCHCITDILGAIDVAVAFFGWHCNPVKRPHGNYNCLLKTRFWLIDLKKSKKKKILGWKLSQVVFRSVS